MAILYKELSLIPNGAHFYTADLHIHSHGGSPDVTDPAMTVEAVVEWAVAKSIGVIAITDHNSDKNSAKSIQCAQEHVGKLLVLAGVEVTTANGHLLVYFAPDALDALHTFVGKLDIVGAGTKESHTKMSIAEVADLAGSKGGVCIAAHIDQKSGFESAAGYPNWKKDLLCSPGLYGVEFADAANLDWYSDSDSTLEGPERRKLLEKRRKTATCSARPRLARVQNSDAHRLLDLQNAKKNRVLTRLKMDSLSFDGFRHAMTDPEARVRAEAEVPPSFPHVVGVSIDGGFLNGETYHLSPNLTCFIGGRGTGKSTAVRTLAYGLGADSALADFDNVPDSVVVYCRDANGILFRYEKMRGSDVKVTAREDGKLSDAPVDAFRIEYFGQGDLAKVAEDPMTNAVLLQRFLDRHTFLSDLQESEDDFVSQLVQNGASLRPLEAQFAGRQKKAEALKAVNDKLKIAEDGKLREMVGERARLEAERTLVSSLREAKKVYTGGLTLEGFRKDYNRLVAAVGDLTLDPISAAHLAQVQRVIGALNVNLEANERSANESMRDAAVLLDAEIAALDQNHTVIHATLTEKATVLQKSGLTASIAELEKLVNERSRLTTEIRKIDDRRPELERLRRERDVLLVSLRSVREKVVTRRKEMVAGVNRHLAGSIDDYTTVLLYDKEGLVDSFVAFVAKIMRGSYFSDESVRRLCRSTDPQALLAMVQSADSTGLASLGGLSADWAKQIVERMTPLDVLHELEVLWKPPRPRIKVLTKSSPAQEIPVKQLSDGQRHTILLTIALVSDSDAPLVIDQPEDDLDNAFVYTSVVQTLRSVKERRQVIVVTHNANIAVLGDAELILPMRRSGDRGSTFDAGSIDRSETRTAAQAILEGGEVAFVRRKEIYGH